MAYGATHSAAFDLPISPWLLTLVIVLIIWAAYRIQRRSNPQRPASPGITLFFATILLSLSLAGSSLIMLVNSILHYVQLPHYQAVVIDHHRHPTTARDSEGRTYSQWMYQPNVEFSSADGETHNLMLDVSSGEPWQIGETVTIGFDRQKQRAELHSWPKLMLLCAGLVMASICWYLIIAALWYALGRPMERVKTFGLWLLLWVIRLVVVAFEGLLLYALYRHFTGAQPMPLWALLTVCFFALIMFLACQAMFRLDMRAWASSQSEPD